MTANIIKPALLEVRVTPELIKNIYIQFNQFNFLYWIEKNIDDIIPITYTKAV